MTAWTKSEIRALKEMWGGTNLTGTEIGRWLGRSRNAVLGKVFRLGLCNRGDAHKGNREPKKKRVQAAFPPMPKKTPRKPKKKREQTAPAPIQKKTPRKPFLHNTKGTNRQPPQKLRRDALPPPADASQEIIGCRYIYGDPKQPDWVYCGRDLHGMTAWCAHHFAVVYAAGQEQAEAA